ncbi:MAG: transcription termination/antitermination protein NusG [Candidatus Uhrbacteria bacterium]|nr:transcription termination/antitermination protein NusG [Candidatus Uhrbacteria bacterium]MDP3794049.1 transcription termination/antitermination protein NusG [Candidatus Uhrbacteria bacterium]
MPKQTIDYGRRWFAIHTYSGYEENVANNLRQRVETLGMQDKIFQVLVPKEKKIKIKNGKRRVIEEKIFPGYVLVDMEVTDESWYVVRNTPNVTGFIGTGTTPTPLSASEVEACMKRMGTKEEPQISIDLQPGMAVKMADGPFKGFEGKVSEIDGARGKVKVLVSMFGRETPLELDFTQVKKI